MEFLHPAMWHDHDIDFARWLHPAMWHVALESWQVTVNSPSGSTLQCDTWLRNDICHWIRPNVRHIGILRFRFRPHHAVDMSFCTSLRNFIQIGPPSKEKKITSCPFSRWRISAVLDFRNPIMRSLKSPRTTSYRSSGTYIDSKLLSFWENRILFYFGDRQADKQTNRQTNRWTASMH